jgi:hypothetical protein
VPSTGSPSRAPSRAHLAALDDFSAGVRALDRLTKPRTVEQKTLKGINSSLEQGVRPWIKPWTAASRDDGTLVFLLYQKGRDSRIFQAQDRAIDDFTLKGKTKETIIANLGIYLLNNCYNLAVAIRLCADVSRVRPVSTPLPTTSLAPVPQASRSSASGSFRQRRGSRNRASTISR